MSCLYQRHVSVSVFVWHSTLIYYLIAANFNVDITRASLYNIAQIFVPILMSLKDFYPHPSPPNLLYTPCMLKEEHHSILIWWTDVGQWLNNVHAEHYFVNQSFITHIISTCIQLPVHASYFCLSVKLVIFVDSIESYNGGKDPEAGSVSGLEIDSLENSPAMRRVCATCFSHPIKWIHHGEI